MERLLQLVYNLDVYISVAQVASTHNFVSAEISPDSHNTVHIEGMYHPFLTTPVGNNLDIDPDNNVVFLTRANMAGKSTFMKTFGICIFLAHMGYSHFYAEVLRVKQIAQEVSEHKKMHTMPLWPLQNLFLLTGIVSL